MNSGLHLDHAALGSISKISQGGQGAVFTAPGVRLSLVGEAVYKEYRVDICAVLNAVVLEQMAGFLESLSFADGAAFIGRAAWPIRVVIRGGAVTGFIMPRLPQEFRIDFQMPSGAKRAVDAEFQHLLNTDAFLANRGIPITDRLRYELLLDLARGVDLLHRHGVTVGDLSPKNVLFSLAPHPRTYFIDCDSMCFRGSSALPQVETPGWEIRTVSTEELATRATDLYKLGLLALRLFVQNQETRDARTLPPRVTPEVRRLIESSLEREPMSRPAATDWFTHLQEAIATAATGAPSPRSQPPGRTPQTQPASPRLQPSPTLQGHLVTPVGQQTQTSSVGISRRALVTAVLGLGGLALVGGLYAGLKGGGGRSEPIGLTASADRLSQQPPPTVAPSIGSSPLKASAASAPPTPPTTTAPPPAPGTVLYQANWAGGGSDGWQLPDNWALVNGVLVAGGRPSSGSGYVAAPYSPKFSNYAVEVDWQWTAREVNGMSISIRDRYVFDFDTDSPSVQGASGAYTRLSIEGPSGFNSPRIDVIPGLGPQSHRIRFEGKGNVLSAFIDGTKVGEAVSLNSDPPGSAKISAAKNARILSFRIVAT